MTAMPIVETVVRVGGAVDMGRTVEVHVDGWPLVCVDVARSVLRVNDLRSTGSFSIIGELCEPLSGLRIDTLDAGSKSLVVAVDTLVVSIEFDPARPTHAAVHARQLDRSGNSTGIVVDCNVRYRQITVGEAARSGGARRR